MCSAAYHSLFHNQMSDWTDTFVALTYRRASSRLRLRFSSLGVSCRRRRLQPADHFFGVFVRRKHRIEHVLDTPVVEHERQPLQYTFTGDLERREVETTGEFEVVITEELKREVKAIRASRWYSVDCTERPYTSLTPRSWRS